VLLFARCGASVILTARRADRLAEVKDKYLAAHKDLPVSQDTRIVITLEADMTNKNDVEGLLGNIGSKKVDMCVFVHILSSVLRNG